MADQTQNDTGEDLFILLQRVLLPISLLSFLYLIAKALSAPTFESVPAWIDGVMGAASVGYLTNWLAIQMLFRPYKKKPVLFFWSQGVIPKTKADIASAIGRQVASELLRPEDIADELVVAIDRLLGSEDARRSLRYTIGPMLRRELPSIAKSLSPKFLSLIGSGAVSVFDRESMAQFLEKTLRPWMASERNRTEFFDWLIPVLKQELVPVLQEKLNAALNQAREDSFLTSAFLSLSEFLGLIGQEKFREWIEKSMDSDGARNEICEFIARFPEFVRERLEADDAERVKLVLNAIQAHTRDALAEVVPGFLETRLPPLVNELLDSPDLWKWLADELIPEMHPRITQFLKTEDAIAIIGESIDVSSRVETAISSMEIGRLHKLVNDVSEKQLGAIQVLGFFLGALAGLLI